MGRKKYRQVGDGTDSSWQLQEAKARFSEVVRRARKSPQHVTVRGKEAVVVLSAEDYERLRPDSKRGLVELMALSPLADVEFGRSGESMPVREVDL